MGSLELGGHGEVANSALPGFMADYRFFFNPIRYTSLGLSVLEAMMVGLPIVGLATTEMTTVIVNGVNGWLDTRPERLVDVMRQLIAEPELARTWGAAARRTAAGALRHRALHRRLGSRHASRRGTCAARGPVLAQHRPPREDRMTLPLHDRRIVVTGGAGFIGSHLCRRLLERGDEVLCVDNFYTGSREFIAPLLSNPRFELMRHDVTFPLYIECDAIFNLACPASPIHYQLDPVQTTKTSVHGAINLLGLAKRLRAPILQASTSEVYGDPELPPAGRELLGPRQPDRPARVLRRGQALRGDAVHGLPPPAPRRREDRAHLQHVRAAHAAGRRPRGVEFHRAGADRRTDDHLRRRPADALAVLRRRHGRRTGAPDGFAEQRHGADQHRQPAAS